MARRAQPLDIEPVLWGIALVVMRVDHMAAMPAAMPSALRAVLGPNEIPTGDSGEHGSVRAELIGILELEALDAATR